MRRINDIEIVKSNLWIATDNYLLVYDQKNNSLIEFKSFGNTENIKGRINIFTKFTDMYQNGDKIYISTPVGILKYSIKDEDWNVIVEPSVYEGSKANIFISANGYYFIGVEYGIWQINIENGFSQLYDYPFIGSVQDMYIQGDNLLIGSNNGLIKYLWKKNL